MSTKTGTLHSATRAARPRTRACTTPSAAASRSSTIPSTPTRLVPSVRGTHNLARPASSVCCISTRRNASPANVESIRTASRCVPLHPQRNEHQLGVVHDVDSDIVSTDMAGRISDQPRQPIRPGQMSSLQNVQQHPLPGALISHTPHPATARDPPSR